MNKFNIVAIIILALLVVGLFIVDVISDRKDRK